MVPHAIVTGAAGDIGAAIVRRFLEDGYRVTAVDVLENERIAARFPDCVGNDALRLASVDVTDVPAITRLVGELGSVHVLVGNAGIVRPSDFLEMGLTDWEETISVNVTANAFFAQIVARSMIAEGSAGRIIFTGSWVGSVPWPGITSYAVSKAALEMLAKQMARELAQYGILVNVVAPGIVDAGMAGHQLRNDPVYEARATKVIPVGHFQTPEQVASAVAFLASRDADYITGTVLLVDGGASLHQVEGHSMPESSTRAHREST